MTTKTLTFVQIANEAGFTPQTDGKLNLPAKQETANVLAQAAVTLVGGEWKPGDDVVDVVLTGAGPVWGHLAIAHALHGRARKLTYAAPNAPEIVIFGHGV